jgi:RNA polymerase sigma-70 factor (ECF subfamily)
MNSDHPPRSFEQTEQFVQLLAAHQRRLYLYILALIQRPHDADEILSDVNMVLWSKFDEFQPGTDFRAWACQVARYRVLKFREQRRLRGNWTELSDEILERLATTTEEHVNVLEARRGALAGCLEKLRDTDRELLDRRNAPGASVVKIAEELGRPLEGLYKAYQRIYRLLAECIDRAVARENHP